VTNVTNIIITQNGVKILSFCVNYRFEAVVLWYMTPCGLSGIHKCFKETCGRHFRSFP